MALHGVGGLSAPKKANADNRKRRRRCRDSTDEVTRSSPARGFSHRGYNKGLDAFSVALNETDRGRGWFVSTKNLQLASLQFCVACRENATVHLQVKVGTPRYLWISDNDDESRSQGSHSEGHTSKRVPALRARGITWDVPISPQVLFERPERVKVLEWFRSGDSFDHDVHTLSWPRHLKSVVFGHDFNQPVDKLIWPDCLKQLTFGDLFNQTVDKVAWPAALQELTFGKYFNQPIDKVVWPLPLRRLTFGVCFDQAIEHVAWSVSLRQLTFTSDFSQPIDRVMWPSLLEQLSFGFYFDQPIANVRWPASLRRLTLGACFDWPVDGVIWPASLEELEFGFEFDQAIDNVVWPASLRRLTFGACFDQPIDSVVWPASLQHLTLGCVFNHPLHGMTRWPSTLAELTLLFFPSSNYVHSLVGVAWPTGLRRLTLGCRLGSEAFVLPLGTEVCCTCQPADCYSGGAQMCWYHNGVI